MRTRITLAVCATVLFCSTELQAQSVPAGALPVYYNGGFAGEAGSLRVTSFSYLGYGRYNSISAGRTEWMLTGSYISADKFFKKIRSGIAFTASCQGDGHQYRSKAMSFVISPKFSFKGRYTFAPFVKFSFARSNHRNEYFRYFTPQPLSYDANSYGINTGFLINSQKAYLGIAANVFGYLSTSSDLLKNNLSAFKNMVYVLQTGYTFQRTPESRSSFTPQMVVTYHRVKSQDRFTDPSTVHFITLADLNLMFRYKKFIYGISSSGLALMFGYQNDRFKLLVNGSTAGSLIKTNRYTSLPDRSYRFVTTIRGAGPDSYSGSISLRYILKKKPSDKLPGFHAP